LYIDSDARSVAASRDEEYSAIGADGGEEAAVSEGIVTGGAAGDGVETGAVDAKRIPAPFRNISIGRDDIWDLKTEVTFLERRGLARMGPWCTEEENCEEVSELYAATLLQIEQLYLSSTMSVETPPAYANGLARPTKASAGYHVALLKIFRKTKYFGHHSRTPAKMH
jgi:hypothetical protein